MFAQPRSTTSQTRSNSEHCKTTGFGQKLSDIGLFAASQISPASAGHPRMLHSFSLIPLASWRVQRRCTQQIWGNLFLPAIRPAFSREPSFDDVTGDDEHITTSFTLAKVVFGTNNYLHVHARASHSHTHSHKHNHSRTHARTHTHTHTHTHLWWQGCIIRHQVLCLLVEDLFRKHSGHQVPVHGFVRRQLLVKQQQFPSLRRRWALQVRYT